MRAGNDLPKRGDIIFVKVTVTDPSDFTTDLRVHGRVMHEHHQVLNMASPSVHSALATLLHG